MVPVSAFPTYEVRSLLCQAETFERLQDREAPFYYQMHALNGRIQKMQYMDFIDILLTRIWKNLYGAFCSGSNEQFAESYQALQKHFPRSCLPLGVFEDTDLVVYPDEDEGELPLNGIRASEFQELKELYFHLYLHLRIKGDQNFRAGVLKDIRMILSRPMGRDLIKEILKETPFIEIHPSQKDEFIQGDFIDFINHTLEFVNLIQVLPNGDLRTLKSPSFINLGHEFIHLLHKLKNKEVCEGTIDLDVSWLDTDREERETIYESCEIGEANYFSENGLRRQFGLLQRRFHQSGIYCNAGVFCIRHAEEHFKFAVCCGIHGNVRALAGLVSAKTFNEAFRYQMRTAKSYTAQILLEEALKRSSPCEESTQDQPKTPPPTPDFSEAELIPI